MVATSAAETLQLPGYNRRWGLLHGARPDIKRVMLTTPVVGCPSATGAVSVVYESDAAAVEGEEGRRTRYDTSTPA